MSGPVCPRRLAYRVTTTGGTVSLWAASMADAIRQGLELTGPRATLLSCLQEGDW